LPPFRPHGVIPAGLIAYDDRLEIDERATLRHLASLADTPGVTAVTINGHSMENHALTAGEQRRMVALSAAEFGDRCPLVCGISADGSAEAARLAKAAHEEGAAALLVFPPHTLDQGGALRPEMAVAHLAAIAEATDLPLIVFQFAPRLNVSYPLDTMLRMIAEVPSIVAVKDLCNDPVAHERHIRTLHALEPEVAVLTSHSAWLLSSLALRPRGILSGAGSVLAAELVELFAAAVTDADLPRAQAINDRLYPLIQAFYAPPLLDMHNRMKLCMKLLGRLHDAAVRPPLMPLGADERDRLRRTLADGGWLADA
jgi:4-hydroxy-tetrahydrodipicolinate synthase